MCNIHFHCHAKTSQFGLGRFLCLGQKSCVLYKPLHVFASLLKATHPVECSFCHLVLYWDGCKSWLKCGINIGCLVCFRRRKRRNIRTDRASGTSWEDALLWCAVMMMVAVNIRYKKRILICYIIPIFSEILLHFGIHENEKHRTEKNRSKSFAGVSFCT